MDDRTEPMDIPPIDKPNPVYARAAVRVNPKPSLREATDEFPIVHDGGRDPWHSQAPVRVPGFRPPARPGRRQLWFGWGWSFTGYMFAFIGWGVWAISVNGDMVVPLIDLGIVTFVAIGVFVVCRLFGRVVWEGTFGRSRRSARLAHALTGLYLTCAGFGFLAHTVWITDAINWVSVNL